jgi:hypothetical protein
VIEAGRGRMPQHDERFHCDCVHAESRQRPVELHPQAAQRRSGDRDMTVAGFDEVPCNPETQSGTTADFVGTASP